MAKFFSSPYIVRKVGHPHDLWFQSIPVGQTVVKVDGVWKTVGYPSEDFLATCSVVLKGGHLSPLTDNMVTELTAAGYAENIVEV